MKIFLFAYAFIACPLSLYMFFAFEHNPVDLVNAATALVMGFIAWRTE